MEPIQDPDKNTHICGNLDFINRSEIYTGGKTASSTNGVSQTGGSMEKNPNSHSFQPTQNSSPDGSKTSI